MRNRKGSNFSNGSLKIHRGKHGKKTTNTNKNYEDKNIFMKKRHCPRKFVENKINKFSLQIPIFIVYFF